MTDQIKTYKEHRHRVESYIIALNSIYDGVIDQIARLSASPAIQATGGIFSFSSYPQIEQQIDEVLKNMHSDLLFLVSSGITDEWDYSTRKNDELVKSIFGGKSFENTRYKRFYNRNESARTAFIDRKVKGLGLSGRIWNYIEGFKQEIELCVDDGLADGRSAARLSQNLRQHLQEPDRLFRRVRNKYGNLVLSQKARVFNPGTGEYRSSYKNAMRVARTEINMAYRTADFLRWQQFDFVIGLEIRLSNNHPEADICNDLAGKYPKDFKFVGWHPQCRCYAIAILCTQRELDAMNQAILDGDTLSSFNPRNQITAVPVAFTAWLNNNADRVKTAKTLPYFLADNKKYINI